MHIVKNSPISEAEQRRRKEAVDYARGSVGLEGFKISKAEEEHTQRFINGEIDLADFVKARGAGPGTGEDGRR